MYLTPPVNSLPGLQLPYCLFKYEDLQKMNFFKTSYPLFGTQAFDRIGPSSFYGLETDCY